MIRNLFNWTANRLIARAMRTPYSHLLHGDGSVYMERYWLAPSAHKGSASDEGCYIAKWYREPSVWLLQKLGIAVRVHRICTPDFDRALHDHPFNWASIVLRGGYLELRPVSVDPCFDVDLGIDPLAPDDENTIGEWRLPGSFAFRRATDRHRITDIMRDTWTLFITGPKVQWWGFYTPQGKVFWRDFESVHSAMAVVESEIDTVPPIPEFLRRTA